MIQLYFHSSWSRCIFFVYVGEKKNIDEQKKSRWKLQPQMQCGNNKSLRWKRKENPFVVIVVFVLCTFLCSVYCMCIRTQIHVWLYTATQFSNRKWLSSQKSAFFIFFLLSTTLAFLDSTQFNSNPTININIQKSSTATICKQLLSFFVCMQC